MGSSQDQAMEQLRGMLLSLLNVELDKRQLPLLESVESVSKQDDVVTFVTGRLADVNQSVTYMIEAEGNAIVVDGIPSTSR